MKSLKVLHGESSFWPIFWLVIIIIIGIVWFNNAHPSIHFNGLEDYRDTWFTGTRAVKVLYCGKSPNIHCDTNGNWFTASATWNGKDDAANSETRWVHYFTINFPNGGWVKTEATCDKAATDWYFYERFCKAYAYDDWGDMTAYLIVPYN